MALNTQAFATATKAGMFNPAASQTITSNVPALVSSSTIMYVVVGVLALGAVAMVMTRKPTVKAVANRRRSRKRWMRRAY